MLEQLAGPFAIVDADGGAITLDPIAGTAMPMAWDDDVGLVGRATSGSFTGYAVVQLDGLAYRRANVTVGMRTVPDLPSRNLLAVPGPFFNVLYAFDKTAGAFGAAAPGEPHLFVGARVEDRYLYVSNSHVKAVSLTDPGVSVTEYTFLGSHTGATQFSRTRFKNIACLIWADGTVVYYDWSLKTEVLDRKYLPANHGAWYSPRLGVFVVIDTNDKLNVYASTVKPYALSDPIAVTPLLKGKVSEVQVTLTGSNGEPCPGELIEWSLAGVGDLAAAQSTTDSDGVATVRYIAPLTLSTDPTITATARF